MCTDENESIMETLFTVKVLIQVGSCCVENFPWNLLIPRLHESFSVEGGWTWACKKTPDAKQNLNSDIKSTSEPK